jgi:O-succinylbenzoic acid--CoA ligase
MGFAPRHVRTDLVAALWGAWRLGAAAFVVDPELLTQGRGADRARLEREAPAFIAGLDLAPGDPAPRVIPAPDQLHTVLLTSGSRGEPRPVRLTHGNVANAVRASRARIGNDASDRWLLTLPVFHVGGLSVLWRCAEAGGTVVIHDGFDAARVAGAMRHGDVTVASLVPTMLHRLLRTDPGPYHGVRAVLVGGAPLSRALQDRARDAGLPVVPTYGMTEACSQVATAVPGDPGGEEGTVGPPLDGIEVTIVDPAGNEVPQGSAGEVVVAGPSISPGYLGEPAREGPHHTGDLGRIDAAGRLVVLGRRDDVIVTGGEKVLPAAVEAVLEAHPAVDRVAVVAVPDEEWGTRVTAVVAATEDIEPAALKAWARERLARHAVPKGWLVVPELPLLANGKIDRERAAALGHAALPAE